MQDAFRPTAQGTPPAAEAPTERRVGGRRKYVHLEPVGTAQEAGFDPYTPPDPWELQRVYGSHQLARALHRYSIPSLRQALPQVLERCPHPDTYPLTMTRMKTKTDLVEYIVARLIGDER